MTDLRRIVWLASYPKSGNTWVRIFLANYLVNGDNPFPINQAHRFAMGDSSLNTYSAVAGRPVDTRDVDTVLNLRKHVLRGIVANGADVNFVKTHNKTGVVKGHEMIPKAFTRSAIYIVRNPLDVVISYARHFGRTHEYTVMSMCHRKNWIGPTEDLTPQFLGRWDDHVRGWMAPAGVPSFVVRYEDLLTNPEIHFAKLLEHIGIPVNQARLEKAIKFSSFEELSGQENRDEFVEKSPHNSSFFNKGHSGQWKEDLEPKLVKKMRTEHRKVMKKYGYLDE